MQNTSPAALDAIFKPRAIAIVGASNNIGKWGHRMVARPLNTGFEGNIYPINPSKSQILGLPAYPDVKKAPGEIDLAVITTPAPAVPAILKACANRGIQGAVVITAGFAEVGEAGRRLEDQIAKVARSTGIRFVGPNCMGIWSAAGKLNLCFGRAPKNGPIAFVSQSGTFGVAMSQAAAAQGYGLSKFVSIGNQADLDLADYLEYLAEDEETRVIAVYLEGLKDGRRFFETARRVIARKPIVIYKAGRSEAAERAAMSHTASVAGSDVVFDGICRQIGLLRVDEAFHLFETAQALAGLPSARNNRVAILGSGGQGVVGTDACSALGMELPQLDSTTSAAITALLPPHAPPAKNPVDFAGSARTAMQEADIIERFLQLDYIDGVISNVPVSPQLWDPTLVIDPNAQDQPPNVKMALDGGRRYACLPKKYNKPIVCLRFGRLENDIMEALLAEGGIPVYSTPEQCARAMHALVHYGKIACKVVDREEPVGKPSAVESILKVHRQGRHVLSEYEAKKLLSAYRIPVTREILVGEERQLGPALEKIPFPLVMKGCAAGIAHKTEENLVRLDIRTDAEARSIFVELMAAVNDETGGVLIQEMITGRRELVMGLTRDPQFGPCVMFGLGGIFTETLRDVSFRRAPLTRSDALEMMQEIKGRKILETVRGMPAADTDALAEMLMAIGRIGLELQTVAEIDLNPVILSGVRPVAVDALIVLKGDG